MMKGSILCNSLTLKDAYKLYTLCHIYAKGDKKFQKLTFLRLNCVRVIAYYFLRQTKCVT